jgi:hypothetical protein
VRPAKSLSLFIDQAAATPRSLRVGARPTPQPHWSTQCSWATRNGKHHAHNSEESVRPLIFGEVIPISQWSITTRHVGHKSAKEFLSLAPLFFHVPFYRFCKYTHQPKVPQCRQTSTVVSRHSGATRIRLPSILHHQNFSFVFLFFKCLDALACQGLLKPSRPQCSIGPTNTKRKDNKRRLYLNLAKNLFIYLGFFSYLHKSKRTRA